MSAGGRPPVAAVVFDMDGVLLQSEELWDDVRRELAHETGARWTPGAHREMMGMSTPGWTAHMHRALGVPLAPEAIRDEVVARLSARYRRALPLVPGAAAAVRRMAGRFPLAVASSSDRALIGLVLELAGLAPYVRTWVASEEVTRGKPAPDVHHEAARRLGVEPARCAAVEDSTAGLRAAAAAGMRVVAIPDRAYPPDPAAVAAADLVLTSVRGLTPDLLEGPPGASR
ncbi:MAG TPA: HAD family phosphatase [Miltoncostaeaceae bacterium]|nr:HAD family phosphatase [Miltoncostaeaceae bacterium]